MIVTKFTYSTDANEVWGYVNINRGCILSSTSQASLDSLTFIITTVATWQRLWLLPNASPCPLLYLTIQLNSEAPASDHFLLKPTTSGS
jgi:hypothetical protein